MGELLTMLCAPTPHEIKGGLDLTGFLHARYGTTFSSKGWAPCLFAGDHKHGDIHPSMQLSKDRHAVKCWAGNHLNGWADCFQVVMRKEAIAFPEARRICAEYAGLPTEASIAQSRRIVRRFMWVDEQGHEAWHLRWEPGKPKFTWAQDKDGRQPGLGYCKPILYGVRNVTSSPCIILVEGERDVDTINSWLNALRRSNIWATTPAYGGSDVKDEYLRPIHGQSRVWLSGDADDVGKEFIQRCGVLLKESVKDLRILSVPEGFKDWTEWADAGGSAQQFETLLDLAELTAPFTPVPVGLSFTKLSDLLAEPDEQTDWLVENRLPAGGLSLLGGKPKAGKSTLARDLALRIARGDAWLGFPTHQGSVFYLALEEKRTEVKKHFATMGATPADPISVFVAPSPADGLQQLRLATDRERPAFIIIDPLFRFVRVKDANDYATMSASLEPLLILARETGAHVMVVHHMGKGKRNVVTLFWDLRRFSGRWTRRSWSNGPRSIARSAPFNGMERTWKKLLRNWTRIPDLWWLGHLAVKRMKKWPAA
jgi:hypothetical protein